MLKNAVGGISDIIHMPGLVSVDFEDVKTVMSEPGKAMMGTASASGRTARPRPPSPRWPARCSRASTSPGARGVLVLIAANRNTFKLAESRNAMNAIRRYASEDAHVIYGTAYDESLGDQLRVTVIATGLSSQGRRAPQAPISVVHTAPLQRTGTDNVALTPAPAQATGQRTAPQTNDYSTFVTPRRLAHGPQRGGEGRRAGEQRHGRVRDPGVPAQAGGLSGGPRPALAGRRIAPATVAGSYNRSMLRQRTLKSLTRAVGSGCTAAARRADPAAAPPDTGIVFRRVDLPLPVEIPVSASVVSDARMASTISAGGDPGAPKVQTIEHLMSACSGSGSTTW